ncbi:MAG: carboxypeptidase regulatory-like domain-containing protein [Halomonadaceae bacterium]|nr:MAG: carboxypeptidase regulatory-like domain-containing protein [Halomonadaceae bacterium]
MTTPDNAQGRASGRFRAAGTSAGAGFRAGTSRLALTLAVSLLVSGCFNSSSDNDDDDTPSDPTTSPDAFAVTPQDISGGPVLDANNEPLDNATAGVLTENEITDFLQQLGLMDTQGQEPFTFNYTTNSDGMVNLPLDAGDWVLGFNKDDTISAQRYRVLPDNASPQGLFITTHSCYQGQCEDIADQAIVGSVTGLVHNDDGPIADAQVGLSGGAATNGAFAQTRTDSDGHYTLTFNVSGQKAHALLYSTLSVTAPDHAPYREELALFESSLAGVNARLEPAEASEILWQETFESDSPTVADWQVDGGIADTTWQPIEAGHGISNTQVGDGVRLAPDDTSEGQLPDPANGISAYWYGDASQGNPGGDPESTEAHSGSLTSPAIDLSGVDSDTPISLRFSTWWETSSSNEAMNHDQERMTVLVSTDGETFTPLAGLTPRPEPQSGEDYPRDTIPFSNQGFNRAPGWTTQEPIPLDALAGESQVRVRFDYQAPEGSAAQFRGWLIDEVAVVQEPGTFPPWQAHADDNGDSNGNEEDIADGGNGIDWNDWEMDEWDWNNWDMDTLCEQQPLYCSLIGLEEF